MTEQQRQRFERRVNITPYRTTSWDPLRDLSLPVSTVWDQDFAGIPSTRPERLCLVREPWSEVANTRYQNHLPVAVQGQRLHGQSGAGESQVTEVDGNYRILVDVKHFVPEEIKVRTVGDVVEIEGSHDEKQDDHGVISRNFKRKYTLPEGVDPMTVTSFVSPNGILTVEAPLPAASAQKTLTVNHS